MKHPEHVTVEALSFPVSFGELPCLTFQGTEQAILSRFGEPHQKSKEELWGEPGPCVYWAFRYSCGLEIVAKLFPDNGVVQVAANKFEVEHILHHLEMPTPELWKVDVNGSEQLSA
jgi:hypothetical protein